MFINMLGALFVLVALIGAVVDSRVIKSHPSGFMTSIMFYVFLFGWVLCWVGLRPFKNVLVCVLLSIVAYSVVGLVFFTALAIRETHGALPQFWEVAFLAPRWPYLLGHVLGVVNID